MLGPSGSGKTTVLRMIAGFETPTAGTISLGGADATRLPPFRRDVNTVFQDYALFPHMSVEQNVGYGLRVHRVAKAERLRRVGEALEMVRLAGFGARRPHQLSGGQRQRVALARALVNRPRVLLLDEPLGALDLKLREQMQLELKAIQREVGITFVFVTHDQDEALTLCDRLAVFRDGRVEQLGSAQQVYQFPATPFVAEFVGTSNLLRGEAAQAILGQGGTCSIRPEQIRVLAPGSGGRTGRGGSRGGGTRGGLRRRRDPDRGRDRRRPHPHRARAQQRRSHGRRAARRSGAAVLEPRRREHDRTPDRSPSRGTRPAPRVRNS